MTALIKDGFIAIAVEGHLFRPSWMLAEDNFYCRRRPSSLDTWVEKDVLELTIVLLILFWEWKVN